MKKKKEMTLIMLLILAAVLLLFAILGSVKTTSEKSLEEQLALAYRYMEELDYDNAIAVFENILELDPKCEEAYLGLSKAYIGMEKYELALEILTLGFTETSAEILNAQKEEVMMEYVQATNAGSEQSKKDEISEKELEELEETGSSEENEGEVYDFDGAIVRVSGGVFSDLSDKNRTNTSYASKWDLAHQVEAKYHIKFEYVELESDNKLPIEYTILNGLNNGECYADIFCQNNDVTIGLKDYLADITDAVDQLEIGSAYVEPGTWNGHTYGWTYDKIGDIYLLLYSRDYLASIGMDKTPADMFMEGKWDYDYFIEYLTELESRIPYGRTYPIGINISSWASMAPAANGFVSVESDGTINLAEEAYASSLEFYRRLIDYRLFGPIDDVAFHDDGSVIITPADGVAGLSRVGEPGTHTITVIKASQMEGLDDSIGEWGIAPCPWEPTYVTCPGDYTTLSDNYKTAQFAWINVMVPKAEYRAAGAKEIPDIVLHLIARDFVDLVNGEAGAKERFAIWEAEQTGQSYENHDYNPVAENVFCTEQDAVLYDWMCSRATVDWGQAMQSLGYVKVDENAAYVIAYNDMENREDARTYGEFYRQSGETNLVEHGLK